MIVATSFVSSPSASLRMQVITVKEVELCCDISLAPFMLCLSYNLLLVFLCAVHAFLTRKLPENFNESWYMFVSVCTTTFLWIVLMPTYFTTFHAKHQAALLAFCLFVNGACTLLCLFLPKIYAIYFVNENDLVLSRDIKQNTNSSTITPSNTENL